MFLGLRSLIYPTTDLGAAKAWYTKALGKEPYFDEPFYVGFDVGGYELGLHPGGDPEIGPMTYWGVVNIDVALDHLLEAGASLLETVHDVGEGIRMASVRDPEGHVFGIIENPHFAGEKSDSAEPGR